MIDGFYSYPCLSTYSRLLPFNFNIYFPFWELFCIFAKMITVRVISKSTLRMFWKKHADVEQSLKSWHLEACQTTWKNPNAIKKEYPSASILNNDRVVFNIRGNKYRLVVKINYQFKAVWIRFIGTHAEYNSIDATQI